MKKEESKQLNFSERRGKMLTGKKEICKYTKYSWRYIKQLIRENNFPIFFPRPNLPQTTENLIDNWLEEKFLKQKNKNNQQI